MDPRLLPIAPFLYFGKRHRQLREALHFNGPAQRSAYNLWRIFDGTAVVHRPEGERVVRPDQVGLSGPGMPVGLTAGSTVNHLAFDVVYRPRYRKRNGCVIDVRMPVQPNWDDLFDHPLPDALPPAWNAAALRFADHAQETYWRGPVAHLETNVLLHHLLIRLIAWQLGSDDAEDTGLVSRAEGLIHERAASGLTVADVASELGVSRPYLTKCFSERRGFGPGKAITRQRLAQACYLLEAEPDCELETIAHASGFSSGSVMRRVFVRELGLAPSRWRR